MSIRRALVDRARVLRREPTATRVEGTTTYVETTSAWFAARLAYTAISDENQVEGAPARVRRGPLLVYGMVDERREDVNLRAEDRVEVDSPQLGRGKWQVDGAPQPLRKRKRLIGHVANVVQVEEG